jgi:cellulose synthase/poly-beta-1,6-N-acetylglucosamine synthase-like glycosyltransferase
MMPTILLATLVVALTLLAAAGLNALVMGYFELHRNLRSASDEFGNILLKTPTVPGVSVIVPVIDASPASRALVRRLLNLHYGNHEVVLVLEGLTAADLQTWIADLRLVPQDRGWLLQVPAAEVIGAYVSLDPVRLMVVHKVPGGRADALNAGVNAAQYPVIGLIDGAADFIPELLLRLIRPMLEAWDCTVAVCGVAPPPAARGLVSGIATLEDLRVWLARCAAGSANGRLLPTPGACLLVKRDAVIQVGGFRAGAVELFVDLHAASPAGKLAWRFALVASPVSYRHAPSTWGQLRRQTSADQRIIGTALGIFPTKASTHFIGLYGDRVLRPLLETVALIGAFAGWYTGTVPTSLALLVPVISIGGGMVHSMAAVVLRELAQPGATAPGRFAMLFFTAVPENLGYRQWRNLQLVARYFV